MHALVGSTSPLGIVANLPRMHLGMQLRGKNLVDRACRQMTVEATGEELLSPIVDGEYYRQLRSLSFKLGPRLRIPKVVGRSARERRPTWSADRSAVGRAPPDPVGSPLGRQARAARPIRSARRSAVRARAAARWWRPGPRAGCRGRG